MSYPLLTAKLSPPRYSTEVLKRLRLQENLLNGLRKTLTVVSAPPGFGKTTLVASSLEERSNDVHLAWLTLHSEENDPARFLQYLFGSLERALPGLTQDIADLAQLGGGALHHLLIPVLNKLARSETHLIAVLDDYHVITASAVHALLRFLIEHLPPTVHLVIISRVDPPLPLARYRASGILNEIRADSLRFTGAETYAFFERALELPLEPEQIGALNARIEGWAVGLQLAVLSLQNQSDVPGFIESFTGSHRYVLHYLLDEVLDGLDAPTRQFLLETSILDALSAEVCNALTGRLDAQEQLETLEERNLFTFALDAKRRWFRYHPLFAQLLQHELLKHDPEHASALHRRASAWFDHANRPHDAVKHALETSDHAFAAAVMTKHIERLYIQGEIATLERWLSALPEGMPLDYPHLALFRAFILYISGDAAAVDTQLNALEATLARGGVKDEHEHAQLKGRLASFQASWWNVGGDTERAVAKAREALAILPEDDLRWRGLVTAAMGAAQTTAGEPEAALEAFAEATRINKRADNRYQQLGVMWRTARVKALQGQLQAAVATLGDVQERACEWGLAHLAVPAYAQLDMAELHREGNRLVQALECLASGLTRAQGSGGPNIVFEGCLTLARLKHNLGDREGTEEAFLRAGQLAEKHHFPEALTQSLEAWRARLELYRGNITPVERWVEARGLQVTAAPRYLHEVAYLTLARLLLHRGQKCEVLALLAPWREAAQRSGRQRSVLEMTILEALAQERTEVGLERLEHAVAFAEREGFVRLFLDEGEALRPLLSLLAKRHPYAERLMTLIRAPLSPEAEELPQVSKRTDSDDLLVEPLSARELEVLGLVVRGLTTKGIAKELGLSVNTVRTHIYSVYSKLNAHNRPQMIARARELGFIT